MLLESKGLFFVRECGIRLAVLRLRCASQAARANHWSFQRKSVRGPLGLQDVRPRADLASQITPNGLRSSVASTRPAG